MAGVLAFLQKWGPHIWLLGSLFGVLMSGTLTMQAFKRRHVLSKHPEQPQVVPRYWFRHSVSFLTLHTGYVLVGVFAIAKVQSTWSDLFTSVFLLATPMLLAARSYDSLRLSYLQRKERDR